MFTFIIIMAIITLIVFGISAVVPKGYEDGNSEEIQHPRKVVRVVGTGLLALTLLLTLIGSVKSVSTKNVGIETAFGRVSGHLSNGLHFTAPWVNVTEKAAIRADEVLSVA